MLIVCFFLHIKSLPNLLFCVLCLLGDQSHPFSQQTINPLACCICWAGLLGRAVFPPWNEGPNFGSYTLDHQNSKRVPEKHLLLLYLLTTPLTVWITTNSGKTSTWEAKHHTWCLLITLAGPEALTFQVLSPRQRGYRVFIHRQAWLSGFVGLKGLGNCTEQDKGEWDKFQFLLLWVPTFWDLCDPDFARSKLSYRGRRSRRSCKILTFPLHFNHWNWSSWEEVGIIQEEKILWSTY